MKPTIKKIIISVFFVLLFSANSHSTYIATIEDSFFVESRNGITSGQIGNWYYELIGSTDDVWYVFSIPDSFVSLISVTVEMIPNTTETIQWDVSASVSALGETYNNDDRSETNQTQAVTVNQLTGISISNVLSGLSPGDRVGVRFESDTDSLRIVGLRFEFVRKLER